MFYRGHHSLGGGTLVVTHTVPCSGRTIPLCTRFVAICSRSACEPIVGVISPEVSTVTPRLSARGRSVSVASSATRDRSACSTEGPLVGAAEQEQCLGEVDRPGVDGVKAVDQLAGVAVRIVAGYVESVCVTAQWCAVRGRRRPRIAAVRLDLSFEPSMVSKALRASSRNSSLRPSNSIRWASDSVQPAGGVRDASQGSEASGRREATLPGARIRAESPRPWPRSKSPKRWRLVREAHRDRGRVRIAESTHMAASINAPCDHRGEPGVAEGEFEANAQPGGSIHGLLPRVRCQFGPSMR